jgi:hypothetical protein
MLARRKKMFDDIPGACARALREGAALPRITHAFFDASVVPLLHAFERRVSVPLVSDALATLSRMPGARGEATSTPCDGDAMCLVLSALSVRDFMMATRVSRGWRALRLRSHAWPVGPMHACFAMLWSERDVARQLACMRLTAMSPANTEIFLSAPGVLQRVVQLAVSPAPCLAGVVLANASAADAPVRARIAQCFLPLLSGFVDRCTPALVFLLAHVFAGDDCVALGVLQHDLLAFCSVSRASYTVCHATRLLTRLCAHTDEAFVAQFVAHLVVLLDSQANDVISCALQCMADMQRAHHALFDESVFADVRRACARFSEDVYIMGMCVLYARAKHAPVSYGHANVEFVSNCLLAFRGLPTWRGPLFESAARLIALYASQSAAYAHAFARFAGHLARMAHLSRREHFTHALASLLAAATDADLRAMIRADVMTILRAQALRVADAHVIECVLRAFIRVGADARSRDTLAWATALQQHSDASVAAHAQQLCRLWSRI